MGIYYFPVLAFSLNLTSQLARNYAGIITIKLTKWLAKKFIVNVDLSLAEEDCFNSKKYYQKESLTTCLRILTENVCFFHYIPGLFRKNVAANPKKDDHDMVDFAKLKNI